MHSVPRVTVRVMHSQLIEQVLRHQRLMKHYHRRRRLMAWPLLPSGKNRSQVRTTCYTMTLLAHSVDHQTSPGNCSMSVVLTLILRHQRLVDYQGHKCAKVNLCLSLHCLSQEGYWHTTRHTFALSS